MGKVALVTGGTRGLGAAITEYLLHEGWNVVATYASNNESAKSFFDDQLVKNGHLTIIKSDICKISEHSRLYHRVNEKYGKIDALVNNAGINKREKISEISEDSWDAVLNTNLKYQFFLTRSLWPLVKASNLKRIIFIASVAGQYHGPKTLHYAVSKAGLISMSKVFARHGASDDIFVNTIAPGIILTDQTKEEFESGSAEEIINSTTLLKRAGNIGDVSSALKFLIDPDQNYLTGQVISISGGAIL